MKIKFVILSVVIVILSSCKDEKKDGKLKLTTDTTIQDSINVKNSININDIQCFDNDTLQFQDSKISVYNEFKIRGKGVLSIAITDKVTILNEDNTFFGEIVLKEESDYEINLPTKIVARSFVPAFDDFSFDAEEPSDNNEYLKIYINKALKKISKKQVEYSFDKWDDYLKKSLINIRNCNEAKDNNTYKIIKIEDNLIKIQSISKKQCDGIENYKPVSKEIKWKNSQDVLLVNFYSCN